MASGQERILRRRIKSIDATKKITRAMELIAGSRIVRAMARVQAAKPYSEKVTSVIANLAGSGAALDHPLLRKPGQAGQEGGAGEADTGGASTAATARNSTAYVVIAADRGLCGGYNTNVLRTVERAVAADTEVGRGYELVLVGRKAQGYFRFRGHEIHATFEGFSDQPSYEDAKQIAAKVSGLFESGQCQQVMLAYTQFVSIGTQEVALKQFMPLDTTEFSEAGLSGDSPATASPAATNPTTASTSATSTGTASTGAAGENEAGGGESATAGGYEFEPEPAVIAERLLPRYAEARLYSALLEAAASEHAARQRAMKAATDNAEDLKTNLTRVMNRARQDAITTEIMEIVSGAEALSKDSGVVDLLSDTIEARSINLFG